MELRLIITYILNLFDLAITTMFVKAYGIEVEANPIGRWLLENNLATPVKIFGIGAALFALYAMIKRYPQYKWASWLVLAVYGVLAVYHIFLAIIIT